MKVYSNFKKYFNTSSRSYLMAIMLITAILGIASVIMMVLDGDFQLVARGIGQIIIELLFWGYFYSTQLTLKRAHIGKSLRKRLGDSDSVVKALDQMEEEMNQPVYSNVSSKRKNNNFIITKNWIIGAEGMAFFRANAVAVADVTKVEHHVEIYHGKRTASHFVLTVTDKQNKTYDFLLKDEDDLGDAFIEARRLAGVN